VKLIIFGATGSVGCELVKQAVAFGHEVSAFSRDPNKLRIHHPGLRLLQGDVMDFAEVTGAVRGQDAAIIALGAGMLDKSRLRTYGTQVIVKAMETEGVRRVIALSAHGVADSYATLPWHYKTLIVPLLLRHVFADHAGQEDALRKSDLDWVIIRATNFSGKAPNRPMRFGRFDSTAGLTLEISRGELAKTMLAQLFDNTYLRQAPSISA
jgi:putative NADH-flavin reductase